MINIRFQGKELFERGLRGISGKAVAQAVVAMQATRESKRLRVLTTAWEIESSIQRTKLLETMLEQDALEYVRSDAEASCFRKLLVGRTQSDLNIDIDFNIGAYNCDITSFVVSDVQLDHIEDLAHKLCLPEEDNDSDDRMEEISKSDVDS
jgi:ribosomal protein S13